MEVKAGKKSISQKSFNKNARDGLVITYFLVGGVGQAFIRVMPFDESVTASTVFLANIILIAVLLVISISACYFWTKYKGLNKWLMLLGIIPMIGFIIISVIEDRNIISEQEEAQDQI
jgi:hypothetical protein